MEPTERISRIHSMFIEHGEFFPEHHRSSVVAGRIELGMTPFEAKVAGGAFMYKVIADVDRWPKNADPLAVMWAQSTSPDNSEIWMTFKNVTQFGGPDEAIFRVHFRLGAAVEIDREGGR